MKLIYAGTNPPADMSGDPGADVTAAQLADMYAAGRVASGDYNVIVQDGPARKYWYPPAAPAPTRPATLSATAFNKYAASKLAGGGSAGMARFMTIMDAGRALAGTAAAFAVAQYDKAITFDKSEVEAFGAILSDASCMTAEEVAAIVADWPAAT